jgi:transcriptional regulator with XRE-family HTH domain
VDFNATRRELGGGIREWRKRRHLTQWELADAADVHVNVVGRVERGKGNPTLKVLWKIATRLKVNVAQLHLGPARE